MQFILQSGLLLKRGARIWQLVRELPETAQWHIEELTTKAPTLIKSSNLIAAIYKGEYSVVVDTSIDPNSPHVAVANRIVDFESLPAHQRKKLELRLQFVKALERQKVTRGKRTQINQVIERLALLHSLVKPPSASSVMSWMRKYQLSGNNPSALLDRHQSKKMPKRVDPKIETILWEQLRIHYFTRNRYSIRFAHEQLLRRIKIAVANGELENNNPKISYQTLARRINDVDLYHRIATREGSNRARMVCRTTFPEGVAEYPLQRAEIDHTPLNWVVICDRTGLPLGRPILTLMIDAYSGYVLGFYVSFYAPGATSLCGVIRNAIMPKDQISAGMNLKHQWLSHGLADEFVVDNGLEFHSFAFKSIAMTLGVDITYSRVRTPWVKPHVERFFSSLDTLTLARGRVSKVVANIARIDPYKDACILFSDFVRGLLMYIVDVHPKEPNWRKMATPFELYTEGIKKTPPAVFPGNLDALKLASGMSKELTLGHGGIELHGLPYGSYAFKELINRHGSGLKLLCKWDPDDMSTLYVRSPDHATWHEAQCRWAEYASGLSFNQHQLIRKFARVDLKSVDRVEDLLDARQRLHDHWMDATSRRGRTEALNAARYANLTSSRLIDPSLATSTQTPLRAEAIALDECTLPINSNEIPSFDTFRM
jgi:putative transposase